MKTVVVTRRIPEKGLQLLKKRKGFRVVMNPHDRQLRRPELLKLVHGADAILSMLTDTINDEVMNAAGPQLKIIANYAVGFNNVDLNAAQKRGVVVTNTPGDLISENVAEHTIALMLALAHRIVESDRLTRAGGYTGWAPEFMLGSLLYGKTLGIVGLGRIGAAVAQRATAGLGMKIVYTNLVRDTRFEKKFSAVYKKNLHALLSVADVVTLHVPLIDATHHLMSTKEFATMKKTAFLVNTARGPIVHEQALLRALKKKQIAGAGLDVFECEPTIDCNIHDHLELNTFPNVVLTPHTASAALETREQMAEMAAQNVIAVLSGKKALNFAK